MARYTLVQSGQITTNCIEFHGAEGLCPLKYIPSPLSKVLDTCRLPGPMAGAADGDDRYSPRSAWTGWTHQRHHGIRTMWFLGCTAEERAASSVKERAYD